MELKPGYKQTEIGVIPEDWRLRKLEEVSTISRLAGAEYTSFWEESSNGEIIALRGFNIGRGKIIDRDFVRISNELSLKLKRSRLCKGDVIYPCVGSIGNAAVITEEDKYHIQQNIARITPNPTVICSRYLANFLMSFLGERKVSRFNASSSQPSVLVGSLRQYRIPLPPTKVEQEAIAEALSDADALIESLEQLIAKKRQLKQGAMQELLTGKRRLPGGGGDWKINKLSEICQMKSGESITSSDIDEHSSFPCFGGNGLRGYTKRYTHEGNYALIGRQGALCGNVNLATGRFFASEHAIVVTPEKNTDIEWLAAVLARMNLNQYSESSAQPGLSVSKILEFSCSVPSKAEQAAIVTILRDMDAEITELETKLAKARAVKQGMMQQLLTGRIRLI